MFIDPRSLRPVDLSDCSPGLLLVTRPARGLVIVSEAQNGRFITYLQEGLRFTYGELASLRGPARALHIDGVRVEVEVDSAYDRDRDDARLGDLLLGETSPYLTVKQAGNNPPWGDLEEMPLSFTGTDRASSPHHWGFRQWRLVTGAPGEAQTLFSHESVPSE